MSSFNTEDATSLLDLLSHAAIEREDILNAFESEPEQKKGRNSESKSK